MRRALRPTLAAVQHGPSLRNSRRPIITRSPHRRGWRGRGLGLCRARCTTAAVRPVMVLVVSRRSRRRQIALDVGGSAYRAVRAGIKLPPRSATCIARSRPPTAWTARPARFSNNDPDPERQNAGWCGPHWRRALSGIFRRECRGQRFAGLALLRPGDDHPQVPASSLGGLTEQNRDVSWPARQILRQNNPAHLSAAVARG